MTNRLPEKLTLLRKHYGYSQGDLAERLGIPVTEYMNWENGNAIPHIDQLKELCDLFHVSVDVMVDNTKEADINMDMMTGSAQIPFMNGQSINATQQLGSTFNDLQTTARLDTVRDESTAEEDLGGTRRMDTLDTGQFTTQYEEPVKKAERKKEPKREPVRKKMDPEKRKRLYIVTAAAAAVVAVIIIIVTVISHRSGNVAIGSVNRLAEGDEFTLYIDSNGTLQTYGNFNGTDFDGSVQVSAYGSHAAGLKSDGTVVTNDDENVADWSKITMIAAGSDHTVGLQSDGSVICTGNVDACEVTDWSGMKAVYAGDGVTAGITSDGTLRVSGNVSSSLDGLSGFSDVAFGDDLIALLDTSGRVQAYSLSGNAVSVDTSTLSDIESISAGNGFVLGLNNSGRIVSAGLIGATVADGDSDAASYTSSDNSSESISTVKDKVESWSNIRYMASYGTTIVAFDKTGDMHGAGDNTYGQYVDRSATPTPSAEADKLETPENLNVTANTVNVTLKWDAVEHADYYTVTMNGDDLGQFETNQASVPTTSFEEGNGYIFRVIAHSNDTDKYKDSDAASYSYTFEKQTTQLGTPTGISASVVNGDWLITWNPVENATGYSVMINNEGDPYKVNTNQLTIPSRNLIDGTTYNISVTATSSSSAYTDSEAGSADATYAAARATVTFTFVDDGDNTIGSQASVSMTPGQHTVAEAVSAGLAAPEGYVIVDESQSFTVSANAANAVTVVVQAG